MNTNKNKTLEVKKDGRQRILSETPHLFLEDQSHCALFQMSQNLTKNLFNNEMLNFYSKTCWAFYSIFSFWTRISGKIFTRQNDNITMNDDDLRKLSVQKFIIYLLRKSEEKIRLLLALGLAKTQNVYCVYMMFNLICWFGH